MGVAMRAGANVQALGQICDVTLAIISSDLDEHAVLAALPRDIRDACVHVMVIHVPPLYDRINRQLRGRYAQLGLQAIWPLPPSYLRTRSGISRLAQTLSGQTFDIVLCMRLGSAQFRQAMKQHRITTRLATLDMDDYESHTKRRMVRVLSHRLGRLHSMLRRLEALKWLILEQRLVPTFDQGLACSTVDRDMLQKRFPGVVWHVVPNTAPPPPDRPAIQHDLFTFTFVGTLDYPPNTDALYFFCREVLPLIRQESTRPFRILIAGRSPEAGILSLAGIPEVSVIANPPEIAEVYAQTDVALAPIRAGGGTRIKILEAFSYGIPMISTDLGAEGIDAQSGEHLLIANDAQTFARCCLDLMGDSVLRTRLSLAGQTRYQERYGPQQLLVIFRDIFADVLDPMPHRGDA